MLLRTAGAQRALAPSLAALALAGTASAQQFQFDANTIPGTNRWTEGVEAADVDNDGDLDLFFADGEGFASAGTQRLPRLVINRLNTDGDFNDESIPRLGTVQAHGKMAQAGDIDNDGWVDAIFSNAFNTSASFLFHNRGDVQPGFFDDEAAARGLGGVYSSACANFGDLDNDGDLDLIVSDSGGSFLGGAGERPHLFFNDGNGNFTENAVALNAPVKSAHMDVQLVDIDNDFDLDFFGPNRASNGGGNHYLLINDGAGNFTNASSLVPNGSSNVYEADLADLDGDTDLDMFFVSLGGFTEGGVRNNLIENGSLSFTAGPLISGGDDNEVALLDVDMDGAMDALVGALFQQREKVFLNNGVGLFTETNLFEGVSDSTLDIEVADLDGDGAYDVISAQGESNQAQWNNKVYFNSGPADTLSPTVLREEALSSPSQNGPWVVRAQVQDQVYDDGENYVTGVATYRVLSGGQELGSGAVDAFDAGGGMFRFAMTDLAVGVGDTLSYELTFTDWAGNDTTTATVDVPLPGCGYGAYGADFAGANVLELAGNGMPAVNGTIDLTVGDLVSSSAFVGYGLASFELPLLGGTLLISPAPPAQSFTVAAAGGVANFVAPVPNNPALAGVSLFFQAFEVDLAQPNGLAFSNGVEAVICP
ncbi:MAG: VCBS repeat-containing protein [Planctomycetota bacterium]